MSAREELRDWIAGVDETREPGLADLTHDVIPVDLARRVLVELDAAHTWNGIMSLLDEHYSTDIFPHLAGRPDNSERDPGPRILSLIREVDRLRAQS